MRHSKCSIKVIIAFLEIVGYTLRLGSPLNYFNIVKSLKLPFLQLGPSYVAIQIMVCTTSRRVTDFEVYVNSALWGCAVYNLHNYTWLFCLRPIIVNLSPSKYLVLRETCLIFVH